MKELGSFGLPKKVAFIAPREDSRARPTRGASLQQASIQIEHSAIDGLRLQNVERALGYLHAER